MPNFYINKKKTKSLNYIFSTYQDIKIPNSSLPDLILESYQNDKERIFHVNGVTHKEYTGEMMHNLIIKFAKCLNDLGFRKGDVIGIILPSVIEYHYIINAILLIGCIASPISPDSKPEDIKNTIANLHPKCLITYSNVAQGKIKQLKNLLPTLNDIIVIDEEEEGVSLNLQKLIHQSNGKYIKVEFDQKKDIAIVPFSSGTSGLHKGVLLSHFNLVANVLQGIECEKRFYEKDSVFLGCTPFFHIYGLTMLVLLPVISKVKTIVIPRFNLQIFLELIQRYKATMAYVVPPVIVMLGKSKIVNDYDLSSLKVLFSGSAPLSNLVEQSINERFQGKIKIKQAYGLTETSPIAMVNPSDNIKVGSAGKLVSNMIAKVISIEDKSILGVREVGEICLAGPNIMIGYHNNQEATKNTIDSEGFLHTGDIGYVDEDGYFYITDRIKELIKVKGYQVPPAELEGVLMKNSEILDCCVIGIDDFEHGELPRAYVVKKENSTLTEKDIHSYRIEN
ncbi:4-coumarate-CoA ligase [Heterostelium album PN500]|uniref:4-coumarate-CoA ligase n=1 Tax=Heterostelium pallidum (strain ATCC 26659 / Pp 5 / PN500) TaxID=670386 RepID=D3BMM9_HETP5|nr:4-coumarate-CoA ligase [Heterostelium album PN500]EFA77241.1 4-coumarate-CoA ligase [Heterostelium album PN500]|eukprot:XP_020429370.1 4-coumarate-CoA ligase [Heterostelium album PN500]